MNLVDAWPGFADSLLRARAHTGLEDSVTFRLVDEADARAVVVTGHFTFLGGSMGVAHGDTVLRALDTAAAQECAVVFVTSSGGARTQEGFGALIQMPRIIAAMGRIRRRGLPIISVFRHPTTGGVHASYGAAADVIIAEAGATVGFAGPRVLEAFTGLTVDPSRSHTAETYFDHGLVDEVVPVGEGVGAALAWVRRFAPGDFAESSVRRAPEPTHVVTNPDSALTGWAAVERARAPMRPSARRVASFLLTDFRETRGDRAGIDDPVVLAGFGRFAGIPVAVIGTDREATGPTGALGAPHASGFRKAARVVRLATRLHVPVLSIVDTRGADATPCSDNAGLTFAVSELMQALLGSSAPTLCAVTGEGGSGGAVAFASTDVLVMQDDSIFEVIAPEGAAAILYRDAKRADDAAARMELDARSLRHRGFVDAVTPGPTTAGVFPSLAHLRAELRAQLGTLLRLNADELQERRYDKYA